RVPPADVAFVYPHGPAQAGFVGVDGLIHVVAPQPQSGFEPGCAGCAQTRRQHTRSLAVLEDRVPDLADPAAVDKELEAILARVAGPRDQGVDPSHVTLAETEVRDGLESVARQQFLRAGALEGDERELEGPIFDFDIGGCVFT